MAAILIFCIDNKKARFLVFMSKVFFLISEFLTPTQISSLTCLVTSDNFYPESEDEIILICT